MTWTAKPALLPVKRRLSTTCSSSSGEKCTYQELRGKKHVQDKTRHITFAKSRITSGFRDTDGLLCSRCSAIDFDQVFAGDCGDANGQHITDLGTVPEDQIYATCPLCRLFAAVRPDREADRRVEMKKRKRGFPVRYHLRKFDCLTMIGVPYERGHLVKSDLALVVAPGHRNSYFSDTKRVGGNDDPQVGLLLLFRSLATSYVRYSLCDQHDRPSGISCALLVEWKGDDVVERIGTAMAGYKFFEKACARREVVRLQ